MDSISNPLYFFSGSSNSPPSTSNIVRFIDILDFFFVAHPISGRKEGEEQNRIMYFHPKGENIDRQTEVTGFAEAVVNFTDNFLTPTAPDPLNFNDNDTFDFRTVTTQRTEHVYIRIEDNQFLMGVSLSKQLAAVSEYPLFQPTIRSVLCDAYKMFRMFFGTFTSFYLSEGDEKFKNRLDFFFSRYIPLLKVHKMPLLDNLGGVEFLRMSGPLYLNVVSLMSELREEYPLIEKVLFLYQDKLLYYQLSKRDLPSIVRYLTHNLLPTAIAPELEPNNLNAVKGSYLRGPTDLTHDGPLLGDEALPVVYLHSPDESDKDADEQIGRYQMMVYRCLNSTICMFVRHVAQSESKTNSSIGVVSRRFLRNVHTFLEYELSQIANKIGDEVGSVDRMPEASDFHYIYFNPASLSMTSSLCSLPGYPTANISSISLPPIDVNRLVCETFSNFVSDSEEFGESFVKSESDWWTVIKKVNSRLLILMLPPSQNTQSLADAQSKTSVIVRSYFEAIFFR